MNRIGSTAETSRTVGESDTAAAWDPGLPAAASTPFVLGLAELACHAIVAGELGADELSVGAGARIEHLRPSPVGATLVARARLDRSDDRRLGFMVEVRDAGEVVARVEHDRAIVPRAAILAALERA
jgi:fluoroacetyl-CoA thioesterase